MRAPSGQEKCIPGMHGGGFRALGRHSHAAHALLSARLQVACSPMSPWATAAGVAQPVSAPIWAKSGTALRSCLRQAAGHAAPAQHRPCLLAGPATDMVRCFRLRGPGARGSGCRAGAPAMTEAAAHLLSSPSSLLATSQRPESGQRGAAELPPAQREALRGALLCPLYLHTLSSFDS